MTSETNLNSLFTNLHDLLESKRIITMIKCYSDSMHFVWQYSLLDLKIDANRSLVIKGGKIK